MFFSPAFIYIYIMWWLRSGNLRTRRSTLCTRFGYLHISTLLTGMLLVSCSGIAGAGNAGSTNASSSATAVPISQLHWCGKPLMVFRDEGAVVNGTPIATATPRTISEWAQFKAGLSFGVFLPETLPAATCLLSVAGTSHDPVFGSSFTIGYLLSDHSALSLSEAPARRAQTMAFQCSATATTSSGSTPTSGTPASGATNAQNVVQLCSGIRGNTSIVFSARGTTATLQHFFQDLRSSVDWLPA